MSASRETSIDETYEGVVSAAAEEEEDEEDEDEDEESGLLLEVDSSVAEPLVVVGVVPPLDDLDCEEEVSAAGEEGEGDGDDSSDELWEDGETTAGDVGDGECDAGAAGVLILSGEVGATSVLEPLSL